MAGRNATGVAIHCAVGILGDQRCDVDLKGTVAIVTGGNGGIGLGMASGLVECGASVVVAGRNNTKNAAAVAEIARIGGTASSIVVDVTDEAQCQAMVAKTVNGHGQLDIFVNNAGIATPSLHTRRRLPSGRRTTSAFSAGVATDAGSNADQ